LDLLNGISESLYLVLNGLSGRSWLLDTLIALPVENPLVKAGPVAACFAFAWYSPGDEGMLRRRRGILLVTLLSLVAVVAVTRPLSGSVFIPRPFIQSQTVFELQDGALVEAPRLAHRVPLEGEYRDRHAALARGEVVQNDLGSFPSDHAGFYFALALGIFLACRLAGYVALGWTLFVILLSRIVTGMHSPLDIAAGAAIGGSVLLALQLLFRRWGYRLLNLLAGWTLRYPGIAGALLFLVLFEATSTLENARHAAGVMKDSVERLAGA
jgi:membrane-associated phospholipid phosphatase